MSELKEIKIDVNKTPLENMHVLIMSDALEEIPIGEYALATPVPYTELNDDYHNTSVVISSTTDKRIGEDTHYYHRVDIGNKGFKDVNTVESNIIARPFNITQDMIDDVKNVHPNLSDNDAILQLICADLGLVSSEFTLTAYSGSGYPSHLIAALPSSYLYIGKLGVKIVAPPSGQIDNVLSGFYTKP